MPAGSSLVGSVSQSPQGPPGPGTGKARGRGGAAAWGPVAISRGLQWDRCRVRGRADELLSSPGPQPRVQSPRE